MAAMNSMKDKDKAKGKGKGKEKVKDKAKDKEKEAGKQPMQCRCLCRHPSCRIRCESIRIDAYTWARPRCALRNDHKNRMPLFGNGMFHMCEEHLRIEIDGFRRDAGGKTMVPDTLVSKLRAPLDPTAYSTDMDCYGPVYAYMQ